MAHNGVWQDPLRYIRDKTDAYTERYDLSGHGDYIREYNFATVYPGYPESVRCGRDNIKYGLETEVLDVATGDTLQFAQTRSEPSTWSNKTWDCKGGAGACTEGGIGFVSPSALPPDAENKTSRDNVAAGCSVCRIVSSFRM
jgi:hypothetical protein